MKMVPALAEFRTCVARHMREQDADEAWLGWRLKPADAVEESYERSPSSFVMLTRKKRVAGIAGVTAEHMIWMLCTDAELSFGDQRDMLEIGRKLVKAWLTQHPYLWNYVSARNRRAQRFVKALGFDVGIAQPIGPSAALFHRFWRSA